jgi:hypothetical protein
VAFPANPFAQVDSSSKGLKPALEVGMVVVIIAMSVLLVAAVGLLIHTIKAERAGTPSWLRVISVSDLRMSNRSGATSDVAERPTQAPLPYVAPELAATGSKALEIQVGAEQATCAPQGAHSI